MPAVEGEVFGGSLLAGSGAVPLGGTTAAGRGRVGGVVVPNGGSWGLIKTILYSMNKKCVKYCKKGEIKGISPHDNVTIQAI